MLQIENEQLKVAVDAKGAELKSVQGKENGLEYMWGADPAFWAKTSPLLFPIVGALKDNSYEHEGKQYTLPRHGFARDHVFRVAGHDACSITFVLESNEETEKVYPFQFTFSLIYALEGDTLSVTYRVQNKGAGAMLFSVGGHPAFKVPLTAGTKYEDYQLLFEQEETAGRWMISKEGLIQKDTQPLLNGTKVLPLTKELFRNDAIVLKHLNSQSVQLLSPATEHGLKFTFAGFPYLGLWAAPGADFLCIEPWCGIADSVDADGSIRQKEGIIELPPAAEYNVQWQVRFY